METKKIDWQIVLLVCSLIIIMIMGVRQSLGLFLDPISSFMGNGKEFFSFAIGVQAIIWGVLTFLLGILIDKEGDLAISLYSETTLTFSKKTALIVSFQSQTDRGK